MNSAVTETKNSDEFIAAMKKSYPDLGGEKNLNAIAGKIFK